MQEWLAARGCSDFNDPIAPKAAGTSRKGDLTSLPASNTDVDQRPSVAIIAENPATEKQQEPLAIAVSGDTTSSQAAAGDAAGAETQAPDAPSAWESSLQKRERRMDLREGRMLAREEHLDTREERLLAKEKMLMERERLVEEREARLGGSYSGAAKSKELEKTVLHTLQMEEVNKSLAQKEAELAAMQDKKRKLEQELSETDISRSPAKRHRVQLQETNDLLTQWSEDAIPTQRKLPKPWPLQ